jgi:predicted nucleotidyltransferase
MLTPTRPIERAVARCLSTRRDIQAAYLFGSVAAGRDHAGSDIDIAVLLAPSVRPAMMLSYRLNLMADLGFALHRTDVDVVILNQAPPLLAHRVLSQGTLVFERSKSSRVKFQVRTAARYLDMIPALETHIRYLKKQVRERRVVG